MKKGIIMEIGDAYLTLLTPEGEFLRSKKQNQIYNIGQEINFLPHVNVQKRKSLSLLKNIFVARPVWAVLAALFIILGSFIPIYKDNKAYAYMSIDSNSSIELGVNKNMQVVELTGLNREGKATISELGEWKKEDVTKVTQEILAKINPTENKQPVIISTVATKEQDEQSKKKLQMDINEIKAVASRKEIDLRVIKATKEERKKARNLGISTGKYKQRINPSPPKKNADQKPTTISPKSVALPPGQQKKKNEKPVITNSVNEKKTASQISPIVKVVPPAQLKEKNQTQKNPTSMTQKSKQQVKPEQEPNPKPKQPQNPKPKQQQNQNKNTKTNAKSKPVKPVNQPKKTK
ncbi:anti-sigma-I factor RsgI family protein [Neobacillus cucumis]|uniref:anti-sigma-I factor RsgI family protein n=1 Tax=Neobacillus cucumis TaxID=1740721 RepID=UPI0019651064|nr:anti-sigma factor domain-containing protein [Neobacillus cucumis]MBM7654197.1 hypothetical protein [Neobacillus cucumis]